MPELPLRGQGFPNTLKRLDVDTPLQGPFWSFDAKVQPVTVIDSTAFQSGGVFPTDRLDSNGTATNPVANQFLAQTPAPYVGWYALKCNWAYFNNDVGGVLAGVLLQVRDQILAVIRSTQTLAFYKSMNAGAYHDQNGEYSCVIRIDNANDQILMVNQALIVTSSFANASIRSRYLGTQFDLNP